MRSPKTTQLHPDKPAMTMRLQRWVIDPEIFASFVQGARIEVLEGPPPGSTIRECWRRADVFGKPDVVDLLIENSMFEEIPEGQHVPEFHLSTSVCHEIPQAAEMPLIDFAKPYEFWEERQI